MLLAVFNLLTADQKTEHQKSELEGYEGAAKF